MTRSDSHNQVAITHERLAAADLPRIARQTARYPAIAGAKRRDVAHQAIQRWIEMGDWTDPIQRGERLTAHFDAAARDARADIAVLRDGRMTRARLAARAGQLAAN